VPSFGARLKQEREQRGVSLSEISQATKISTRLLQALEAEQFQQLPGGIFNKGFIRAYARCLGLDEDQVIADYLVATGALPAENSENGEESAPRGFRPEAVDDSSPNLPWGLFAIVLLMIALAFALWGFYSRQGAKASRQTAASAKHSGNAVAPSVSPASSPPQTTGSAAPANPTSTAAVSATKAPETVATTAAGNPKPTSNMGPLLVNISAREDSWVSISADGKQIMQDTLIAPAEKSVRAGKEIVVKAGNVGALDFALNGKKLPLQGALGEVKTLTFDLNGVRVASPPPPPPSPETPQP